MNIEIWSDVVCPWCYIGKRRIEAALSQFEHAEHVQIQWRSFELDPNAPHRVDKPLIEVLASKYGMSVAQAQQAQQRVTSAAAQDGITMRFDIAKTGNTLDAHRVIHLAHSAGLGGEMKERLLRAYFTEGVAISEHDALVSLAVEVGLDADAVRDMLSSDALTEQVREDERLAKAYGASGVPFFVIDSRYGVSGAQPAETLVDVLKQAWDNRVTVVVGGETCDDDGCAN